MLVTLTPGHAVTGPVQVDSTKSEKCVGVRDFKKILEVLGVRWECVVFSAKSEKCVGVRHFKKILEVLGVRWECVAHFCLQ